MSQKLVELFQQTINKNLHLKGKDKIWLLKDTPPITMKAPSRHSLGFSLDCKSLSYGNFFGGSPPSSIAKMCDAIIVLSYKDKAFIFAIEQKTGNKGNYKKQLANGKYFCDWLLVLLKKHTHYDGKVVFIGLLCWSPRASSPRKGTTHHGNGIIGKNLAPFHMFFEVRDQTHIYLQEFIK